MVIFQAWSSPSGVLLKQLRNITFLKNCRNKWESSKGFSQKSGSMPKRVTDFLHEGVMHQILGSMSALSGPLPPDSAVSSSTPQVMVIHIGDNDLWHMLGLGHAEIHALLQHFYIILEQVAGFPNSFVVIVGLLPYPAHDERVHPIFSKATKELKVLAFPAHAFVVNPANKFTKNGLAVAEYFETDGVHLNATGAAILARQLAGKLGALPSV